MSDDFDEPRQRAVPSGRTARITQFGRLAAGVGGGMLAEGARRLAAGERPRMGDLLMTPANFARLADRLSHLRGAAMKLGQMISMDAGDFLPAELAQLLSRLRDNAHHMPPQQLQQVLAAQWGKDWRTRFARFEPRPIAAASIGQVHRAHTHDGRTLAIKVQYPGVRQSIDSDIDNVATLLRVSGLLPTELNIAPLLAEAKTQLAEEADYGREGGQMMRFHALLADDPAFVVPRIDEEFTTDTVLAMSFVEGRPVETLADAPQEERDAVMTGLIRLVLRELFEFGVMQTDPNFANYRYQPETRKLVLLDFGATRDIAASTAAGYRQLVEAALAQDREAIRTAALDAGFVARGAIDNHSARIDRMIEVILGELHRPGPFDFGDRAFVDTLRDQGMEIAADKAAWHLPPADMLFVQRKISGTALLAARLKARVDVRTIARDVLNATEAASRL
ncbi:AarF/ABC1/UbiB kinase family protein [Sphingomonas sp. LY160]|uniref:ABC1 kinase family protein n=1 Tax=Sphingomonas sp. LY160 TaxID=3095342 RepID=UPI002ADEE403|nr:AarF/ABC1/UbiB kinase family protein [Sphingomonas sp. LY160]MEA1072959.1 AarF/ABC1/UbiB kinase family protein [Sphingomonas sp. LY160]